MSSIIVELGHGNYGIVTDSDLRSKVVAGRLSPDDPVSAAMTTPIVGVTADQTGADVMMTMIDHDIRHVPVFSARSEVLGVIVAIDLVAAETGSPFVLRRAIAKAKSKDELSDIAGRLNSTVVALHRAELAPVQVSEVTSAVADALIGADDRAGDRDRGPAARRVLLDVARQPRQARAGSLLGRRLRDGVERRPRAMTRSRRPDAPSPRVASANTCAASRITSPTACG